MNTVDILFIVDITGSMHPFIEDARKRMKDILNKVRNNKAVDIKVGLSLYRDHPSQGDDFVTTCFDLRDIDKIQDILDKITVGGGGDIPEAVIDGIIDGVSYMNWRTDSRRIIFLIGDAPAHGIVEEESCCQCGKTWGDAAYAIEDIQAILYAIPLSDDLATKTSFKYLSNYTGGFLIETDDAIEAISKTLNETLSDGSIESKVLREFSQKSDKIEDMLKTSRS